MNVYTPISKRELSRLPYRFNEWDPDFLNFVWSLEKNKPVIFCGDLNVAHTEIDLANPKTNKTTKTSPGNAGFTDEDDEMPDFFFNEPLSPSGKKQRHASKAVNKHLRTLINA